MPVTTHSVFGASASKMWLSCFAYARMIDGIENQTNPAAELGTAAHELGEYCLQFGLNTYDCLGLEFNKHIVDEEMADAVQIYVGYIRELCVKYGVNPMLEKKVYIRSIGKDIFGTSDCIVIIGDWLFVIDYKHGMGVVEVTDNPQAAFYALAVIETLGLGKTIKWVSSTIVQPRADHIDGAIRSQVVSIDVLAQWHKKFLHAITEGRKHDSQATAGEHCRYCPARGRCRERALRTFNMVFGDKPVDKLSDAEISMIFNEIKSIEGQILAVKSEALNVARSGGDIEGYKLVKAIARAKCSDEKAFIAAAKKEKPSVDLFNTKLKSMTDLKKTLPHKLVNEHFKKPDASSTLAPLNDNRPAFGKVSAKGVFTSVDTPKAAGVFEPIK